FESGRPSVQLAQLLHRLAQSYLAVVKFLEHSFRSRILPLVKTEQQFGEFENVGEPRWRFHNASIGRTAEASESRFWAIGGLFRREWRGHLLERRKLATSAATMSQQAASNQRAGPFPTLDRS